MNKQLIELLIHCYPILVAFLMVMRLYLWLFRLIGRIYPPSLSVSPLGLFAFGPGLIT